MTRKAKALVLDTWAVIAYLEDEPSAQEIADLIANAHEEGIPVYMTVVNVGEVWYTIAREVSEEDANSSVKELRDLRIRFENVDWELTQEAARFKAQYKMSYADCYAAALAKVKKADLVTGDKEFKPLEEQIKIAWV
ncbi:MAG: type II toxin-antitoxin system VapC family toxin [Chloroflexota bacterium]